MLKYTADQVQEIFSRFGSLSVMVIGDVMIDSYIWGKVTRISPEAPVPIVTVTKRSNRLGGAANVAINLKSLGSEVFLCSVIGGDEKASVFQQLMDDNQLSNEGIISSDKRITTTKFRVIGNNVQLLRVDEETDTLLTEEEEQQFLHTIQNILQSKTIDVIIFQDYDKGVITPEIILRVVEWAEQLSIPVAVDPKKRNFLQYSGVTLFKPNLKELSEGMGISFDPLSMDKLSEALQTLHVKLQVPLILTTLSDEGIYYSRWKENGSFIQQHVPAHRRSVADVSGAGDTVVSVASLALAAGLSDYEIAAISNLAGGLVCESVGVVPVDKQRLMNELLSRTL